ncbi:MAG: SMP-30/gluconolactonase/LRE family protein [Acidobacteriota bacterium]
MKALLSLAVFAAALHGQVIRTVPYKLVRIDPALDSILTADAPLEILGQHFGLTEGPVWVKDASGGYLLFSDCAANVIYKWQPNAPLSVFLERSGFTGSSNLNAGQQTIAGRLAILLIGSNGLALDPQGRLIITAMADRTLVRLEKDGSRTVLAERYEGKRFSGPNDVAVKSNGSIYFTDSVNGLRGGGDSPQREIPYNGFYLVKDGKITLLGGDRDKAGEFPNGIALSPDEKTLYVTAGMRKTMAYDVLPDDTVANPRVFVDGGNDGIKTDNQGNVYQVNAAGQGEIWITAPNGERLGTIQLPQIAGEPRPRICASNVAFGDADGKGLYITSCTHVFRVRLRASGLRGER